MNTLTLDEATRRAEHHIERAVAALPVKPRLTLIYDGASECLDPTDGGPPGRYIAARKYWLDDLPPERNAEVVDALYEHWSAGDFRVLNDERSADDRFVSVENGADAFRMSVKQSADGHLSLGASSPCVWPDGVPPESS